MPRSVSFIARAAEFTPPVIYSLEERDKLVFLVEARPDKPDGLRVGQPVQRRAQARGGEEMTLRPTSPSRSKA